jgi:hypothetical protein
LVVPLHFRPESADSLGRGHNVGRFQQAANLGLAFRKGAQNERPVRDGFVARRAGAAL